MPVITLNLTDEAANAVCAQANYQDQIAGTDGLLIDNPQSPADFLGEYLTKSLIQAAISYTVTQATQKAQQNAISSFEGSVTIT